MSRFWIAVASREHVCIGRAGGFMQVCHGKVVPLRRVQPGDWVVYYSPTEHFGGCKPLQAFTAVGIVRTGEPYQVEMALDFHPWRRNVDWLDAKDAPIVPLLDQLTFSSGRGRTWGYPLRFGLLEIKPIDFQVIAGAMGVVF